MWRVYRRHFSKGFWWSRAIVTLILFAGFLNVRTTLAAQQQSFKGVEVYLLGIPIGGYDALFGIAQVIAVVWLIAYPFANAALDLFADLVHLPRLRLINIVHVIAGAQDRLAGLDYLKTIAVPWHIEPYYQHGQTYFRAVDRATTFDVGGFLGASVNIFLIILTPMTMFIHLGIMMFSLPILVVFGILNYIVYHVFGSEQK